MLHTKYKWLGLIIMTIVVVIGLVAGALVFNGKLSVEDAYTIAKWGFFPAVIGFGLHMIVVVQQRKEKRQKG